MGKLFRLPLQLRAEPRLWGARVLDHPKNPPEWRGKAFAMDGLLTTPGEYVTRVRDAGGGSVRHNGREVWLKWSGIRESRLFFRAKRRWCKREREAGTLNVVCGDSWSHRGERQALWFIMAPMFAVLVAILWFQFMLPFLRGPASHRTLVDWLVVGGFCGMTMAICGGALWLMSRGSKRSCLSYRLTSTAISPLDGRFEGREFPFASCTDFDSFGLQLKALRFGDERLIVDRPPIPVAELLGRQEESRRRTKRVYRRLLAYGIIGAVLYVVALVVTQPITGVPLWRPLLGLAVGGPAYVVFGLYGRRWMEAGFAWFERRRRQRTNRDDAAMGRSRG